VDNFRVAAEREWRELVRALLLERQIVDVLEGELEGADRGQVGLEHNV
jgi:hypothetical protein